MVVHEGEKHMYPPFCLVCLCHRAALLGIQGNETPTYYLSLTKNESKNKFMDNRAEYVY